MRDVHEAVRRAVAQTLYEVDRPGWGSVRSSGVGNRVSETTPNDLGFGIRDFGYKKSKSGIPATRETSSEQCPADIRQPDVNPKSQIRNLQSQESQPDLWQQKPFGHLRVIGQFHNSYIVCESEAGLILIDQHAAHERVLYEQFSARASGAQKSSQRLLVPETIELGYREAGILEKMIPQFQEMGLDIEPFGGSTFVVKAVPLLLAEREIKPILIEMVEKIAEVGTAPGPGAALDQSRMVMACHAAIRANQALSETQIKGLLGQLDGCHNPSHCPHGRPTWIRWDMRSLDKSFKRIV